MVLGQHSLKIAKPPLGRCRAITYEALQLRDASFYRRVLIVVVIGMQKIDLNRQQSVKPGLGQFFGKLVVIHHTIPNRHRREEIPFIRRNAALDFQIFDVRCLYALGQLVHTLDGIIQQPHKIPGIEVYS